MRATADPGPEELPGARIARILAKAPVLWALSGAEFRAARQADAQAQLERARRVGRDHGVQDRADFGPGLRLETITAPDGTLLREADVMVVDEPVGPQAGTVRRARRSDPLRTLWRGGTIDEAEWLAGERLRSAVERSMPSLPGVARSEVHVAPHVRASITGGQLAARRDVRLACAAMERNASIVLWVALGGTIRGCAAFVHVRHTTVAEMLIEGLETLAAHYGLRRRATYR
jgi:hypothetical protein